MTLDIKDFNYGIAMACYDYTKLDLACIPNGIVDVFYQYKMVHIGGFGVTDKTLWVNLNYVLKS